MVALNRSFDHTSVDPTEDFPLLPAGFYGVEVVEADEMENKRGTGRMIKLALRVIDTGEYENRRVWCQINYQHENADAQRISQQLLSSLCAAVGVEGQLTDTDQLIGVPVIAKVSIRPSKDANYSDQNEVKLFRPYENAQPPAEKQAPTRAAAPPPRQQTSAKPPAKAAGDRPWQRRA